MTSILGMAAGSIAIQLGGAYLRYLPFEAKLPPKERLRLWRYLLGYALLGFALYVAYYSHTGIAVEPYKRVNYFGWIPFFALSLLVIRNEGPRHTFIVGMQTLWYLLLHTLSGSVILSFFPHAATTPTERIPLQTGLYIAFFLLLLPVAKPMFRNLLPSPRFFDTRPMGWYFALLPLGLCVSPIVMLIDRPLMYTWQDRVARIFLLLWVFIIYRFTTLIGQRSREIDRQAHTYELLGQQLSALQAHAALLENRAQDVRRARHDLRHYNRLLATLLDAGEAAKARELIEAQDRELLAPPLSSYCRSPIVNAALTVYMQQAKSQGIPVSCKVKLDDAERPLGGGQRPRDFALQPS